MEYKRVMKFRDRFEAGSLLADRLETYRNRTDAIVFAIPRGGVELGFIVARRLGIPLDVLLLKKLGHPDNPEFAIGSVGLTSSHINKGALEDPKIPPDYVPLEMQLIRNELRKKYVLYRGCESPLPLAGKVAIVVDDGVATGSTMLAGLELARKESAKAVVVAVPLGPKAVIDALSQAADQVICLQAPDQFDAVGSFYSSFDPVSDDRVVRLLKEANLAAHERSR